MRDMFEEFILKINVMFALMHFKEMKVRTMNTFERFPCDQCGNVLWRLMVCVNMFKDFHLKKMSAIFMLWRNKGVSENV